MTAGDAMIDAIADAVASRLEKISRTKQRLLSLTQAADYLGLSEDTIGRLITQQKLNVVRVDSRPRFDVRDLDRLVEESKKSD